MSTFLLSCIIAVSVKCPVG